MHPIIKNVLAVIAGLLVGSIVNGLIISLSPFIIPPPEGADLTKPDGLKAAMSMMQPKHFIMPFFAHAIGTLVGALTAFKISSKPISAYIVALFFLFGGLYMVSVLPSPLWFNVLDLSLAYIPMAWLALKFINMKNDSLDDFTIQK